MSGLGPAACWLAHKRLESWSRLAKERVGGVRKSSKSEEKPSAPSPINTDLAADSISSSTEVGGWQTGASFVRNVLLTLCYSSKIPGQHKRIAGHTIEFVAGQLIGFAAESVGGRPECSTLAVAASKQIVSATSTTNAIHF